MPAKKPKKAAEKSSLKNAEGKGERPTQDQLIWIVPNRSKTQEAALKLYVLLRKHEALAKSEDHYLITQALTGISFALWRAVFLADKTTGRGALYEHALEFLETVIMENSVQFSLDRRKKNWTFNYYMNDAKYRLEYLRENYKDVLGAERSKIRNEKPTDRWCRHQHAFEAAIDGFRARLEKADSRA